MKTPEVIEAVAKDTCARENLCICQMEKPDCVKWRRYLDETEKIITAYESATAPQWSDVEDVLPEAPEGYSVGVLVWRDHPNIEIGTVEWFDADSGRFHDEHMRTLSDVTHWMPLPSAPEGE